MLTPEQNNPDALADGKGAVGSNRGSGLYQKTGLIEREAGLDHGLSVQTRCLYLFGSVSESEEARELGTEELN